MKGNTQMRISLSLLCLMVFGAALTCAAEDEMKIGGVGFLRYSTTEDDDNAAFDAPDDFDIFDVKIYIKGSLDNEFSYKALYSVRQSTLWDAFVKYSPDGLPLNVTLGQFKVPFSLAGLALACPAPLQETIRGVRIYEAHPGSPVANPRVGPRDIGLKLDGDLLEGKLGWSLGVYNGTGINADDDNDQKDVCAAVTVSPLKGSGSPLAGLSFGGAYWAGHQPAAAPLENGRDRYSAFLKYSQEELDIRAEYIAQNRERTGDDMETTNWYLQASYKVTPEVGVVARYQQYDPDGEADDDAEDIVTVGVNWYVGERVTLRANYNLYEEEGTDVDNNELIIQVDVKF